MPRIIWIGLAGFAGTLLRYWLSGAVAKRYGETFPYGTLAVNALGCLLAGALFYLMYDRFLTSPTVRSMVFIGLLGGFTTFSSFGLQNVHAAAGRRNTAGAGEHRSVEYCRLVSRLGRLSAGGVNLMNIPEEGYLLRIFVGESDRCGHRPLYEDCFESSRSRARRRDSLAWRDGLGP